jgi:hypothetical protein
MTFELKHRANPQPAEFSGRLRPVLAANKTSRKTERCVYFAKKASLQPTKSPTKGERVL